MKKLSGTFSLSLASLISAIYLIGTADFILFYFRLSFAFISRCKHFDVQFRSTFQVPMERFTEPAM